MWGMRFMAFCVVFLCGLAIAGFRNADAQCGYPKDCGPEVECESSFSDSYAVWVMYTDTGAAPVCPGDEKELVSGYCSFTMIFDKPNCTGEAVQQNNGQATLGVACS